MANIHELAQIEVKDLSPSQRRVYAYWRHVIGSDDTALELARLAYYGGGRDYTRRKAAVLGVSVVMAMTAGRGQ